MRIRKDDPILEDEEALLIAKVSDALSHPARVHIFRFIYNANKDREPVCNKDVVAAFDYAQATISQHIRKLVISGLLKAQKKNSSTFYYVNIGMLSKYLEGVKKLG